MYLKIYFCVFTFFIHHNYRKSSETPAKMNQMHFFWNNGGCKYSVNIDIFKFNREVLTFCMVINTQRWLIVEQPSCWPCWIASWSHRGRGALGAARAVVFTFIVPRERVRESRDATSRVWPSSAPYDCRFWVLVIYFLLRIYIWGVGNKIFICGHMLLCERWAWQAKSPGFCSMHRWRERDVARPLRSVASGPTRLELGRRGRCGALRLHIFDFRGSKIYLLYFKLWN